MMPQKMLNHSSLATAVLAAGLLVSCASNSGSSPTASNQAPSPAAPTTTTGQAAPAQPQPNDPKKLFSKLPDPATLPRMTDASLATRPVAGLIQPTTPNQRMPEIVAGRSDPFAAVGTIQSVSAPTNLVPKIAPLPRSPQVNLAPLPVAPAANPAALANAVEVTGVMQAGRDVMAIVKAPEEQTSRYVRVGDYLSNGKVLVKRIDAAKVGEPVVVLEQNGVEVIRPINSISLPTKTS